MECGLDFTDARGEGDGGADVTFFAQGALEVEPSTLIFELNFNRHGVVATQSPVSTAVDLRGSPKKLSNLDQTHGVGHHTARRQLKGRHWISQWWRSGCQHSG